MPTHRPALAHAAILLSHGFTSIHGSSEARKDAMPQSDRERLASYSQEELDEAADALIDLANELRAIEPTAAAAKPKAPVTVRKKTAKNPSRKA